MCKTHSTFFVWVPDVKFRCTTSEMLSLKFKWIYANNLEKIFLFNWLKQGFISITHWTHWAHWPIILLNAFSEIFSNITIQIFQKRIEHLISNTKIFQKHIEIWDSQCVFEISMYFEMYLLNEYLISVKKHTLCILKYS